MSPLDPPGISIAVADARYGQSFALTALGGTTDERTALATADTAATTAKGSIVLRPGVHRVSASITINSPVVMQSGAVLKPDSGAYVTLAGGVTAPKLQVFDHSAGGVVAPQKVDYYHPAWWGPVGTADDTPAWSAMADALNTSKVTDSVTTIKFGQRIMAPPVSRFFGITLSNCVLEADKGTNLFYPSGDPTTGTMLTLGDYCAVLGGYWRTNGNGQAVNLLSHQGYRSRIEGVYMAPRAAGSVGILVGNGPTITPVLTDIQINPGVYTNATGIYLLSADAELTNIWVANLNKGIDFQRGACSGSIIHVWSCTTGLSGNPDMAKLSNLYIDSNLGWGIDFDGSDRCVLSNFHVWNNGTAVAGTGGIRLRRTAGSSRDNVISNGSFDDNTGVGLLIDGPIGTDVRGARFGSSQVQGGGAAVTDTGCRVTSASSATTLDIRGRKADHVTAVLDDQGGSAVDLGSYKKVLTADVAYTSNATSVIFSLPLGPGEKWLLEGLLVVDGGQTGDLRLRAQATSATGASGYFALGGAPTTGNTSTTNSGVNPINAAAILPSAGNYLNAGLVGAGSMQGLPLSGYVATADTPGTLEVVTSQNTTDAATPTTVRAGSWLRAVRIG